jgi:4-aminobutyrate aminotransferase
VLTAPFPYWHHFNAAPGADESEIVRASLYQLELLLSQQTAPSDTAAIIIEPVLGEGGYVPAPPAFLQGLRAICDKHGLLLIIDEVQSGFGRTGRMFSIEYSGVRPDIMLMAKVRALLASLSCWTIINYLRVLRMDSRSVPSSAGRS